MKPLAGLLVLDFAQFLAGPWAATRLADLGARVIKIERPGTGDIGRHLYISNLSNSTGTARSSTRSTATSRASRRT